MGAMMNEARPFASLSGNLLARKGGAKPAMRPQPFAPGPLVDDLGWDDHGDTVDSLHEHVPSSISALTPAPKLPPTREEVVHVQQRALSDHFGEEPEEEEAQAVETATAPAPAPVEVEAPEPAAPVASPAPAPAPARTRKAAVSRAPIARPVGQKAAFTLRLDADRHLRLRLASAVHGKSSQQLVTAALDAFLNDMPEVGQLARQLPARDSN